MAQHHSALVKVRFGLRLVGAKKDQSMKPRVHPSPVWFVLHWLHTRGGCMRLESFGHESRFVPGLCSRSSG